MNWQPGQTLQKGKYLIKQELRQGGFGMTYLAFNKNSQKNVVIKTLKDEIITSSDSSDSEKQKYKDGFNDEALRLALCRHPNIVEIETVFYENSIPCIVMEYIQGETLWDRVKNRGVLTETEALTYIKQIGSALKVVHEIGLLHRDVKPQNILIRANSNDAVLIDFGIARQYLSSRTFTSMNTDGFSPIEQYYENQDQGPYTDVYALAATLYYLLVGERPLLAWARLQSDTLKPANQRNSQVTDRVNQAIIKGMEIDATKRPSSIQDWLEMLDDASPLEHGNSGSDCIGESYLNLRNFSFDVVFLDVRGQEKVRERCQAELFEQVLSQNPFLKLDMIKIPAGRFLMGSPDVEIIKGKLQESKLNERPQHLVNIDVFFMSRFAVTQAIWKFVAELPQVKIYLNSNCSNFNDNENNPVEEVSWFQAIEFCARLSQLTNLNYRLPSEAEWEYACRAGIDNKPFHFGDTITTAVSNYDGTDSYNYEPIGDYYKRTKPVGSFGISNGFGLCDMHGNVWEWCADSKHDNYQDAPLDGRPWDLEEEADNTILRVLRGGAWNTKARECRAANRRFLRPNRSDSSYGFRVALSDFSS